MWLKTQRQVVPIVERLGASNEQPVCFFQPPFSQRNNKTGLLDDWYELVR